MNTSGRAHEIGALSLIFAGTVTAAFALLRLYRVSKTPPPGHPALRTTKPVAKRDVDAT